MNRADCSTLRSVLRASQFALKTHVRATRARYETVASGTASECSVSPAATFTHLAFAHNLWTRAFPLEAIGPAWQRPEIEGRNMSQVLLIDDDLGTLAGWTRILGQTGFEVLTAGGHEGITLVLRRLSEQHSSVLIILATGLGAIESAVEGFTHADPRVPEAHAASRWARVVARVIDAPSDPKTLQGWGRVVGASPGTLKNWCRMVGLPSKRSLDFARVLRAVVRHEIDGFAPQDSLDVSDRRTLRRLLALAGLNGGSSVLPRVEEFIRAQRFINDQRVLLELRRALKASSDPSPHD